MAREIKFRAWDKWNKRFVPTAFVSLDGRYFTPSVKHLSWNLDIEVSQYTGLLDKQGKEIYEGDILGHALPEICVEGNVEFLDGAFKLRAYDGLMKSMVTFTFHFFSGQLYRNPKDYEVIGNIWENPELLKDAE